MSALSLPVLVLVLNECLDCCTAAETTPKVLFTSLPVMMMSANVKKEQEKVVRDVYGAQGPYLW